MGALDRQVELPAQKWEEVKRKGDSEVEAWINEQMNYKQAVVVLIGNETASRKFVQYEIDRAWTIRKPMLGIRIHGLKDASQKVDRPGKNPFELFDFSNSAKTYADYVPVYDPAHFTGRYSPTSADIYSAIQNNIAAWVARGYRHP